MKEAEERGAESWRLQEELERAKLEVDMRQQTLEAFEAERRLQFTERVSCSFFV